MRYIRWFWIRFKRKCPVIPGSFHFRVIVHDPIGSPKKFQNILMWSFKVKANQSFQYETYCIWFWIQFKRKCPVISGSSHFRVIVHDPMGSRKRFQNILMWSFKIKANQSFQYETYYIWFWIQFKRKCPVISGSLNFRVIVQDPMGSHKKFQDILMRSFKIKAHQIWDILHMILDSI